MKTINEAATSIRTKLEQIELCIQEIEASDHYKENPELITGNLDEVDSHLESTIKHWLFQCDAADKMVQKKG